MPAHRLVCMLAAAAGLSAPSIVAAQVPVLQSPLPWGAGVHAVFPLSPTRWIALGSDPYAAYWIGAERSVRVSTDAGRTWTNTFSNPDPNAFGSLVFTDPTHGYICGGGTDAYRSTDAGATWTPMTYSPFPLINDLAVINPLSFFTGDAASISFTPDGGSTWQTRSTSPVCPRIWTLAFRDENVGLVAGQRLGEPFDNGFYRTTDGGQSWTLVRGDSYLGGTGMYPAGPIVWIDQDSVVAAEAFSTIKSLDAGLTWSPLGSDITTGLAQMERIGSTDAICGVSGQGDIWRSDDLGQSWMRIVEGIGTLPARWSIHFVDPLFGWVTGPEGEIYLSTDGGLSWSLSPGGVIDEVRDIGFFSDAAGIAVTTTGFVMRTIDAGAHWDVTKLRITGQAFGRNESLNALSVVGETFAAVAGDGGTVFKTSDAGATWEQIPVTVNGFLLNDFFVTDVHFVDSQTGWVVGSNLNQFQTTHNVWVTHDGGATWQAAGEFGGLISSVQFVGNVGWMGLNQAPSILRSTDAGAHWSTVAIPDDFVSNARVRFGGGGTGFVAGMFGYLARSTNGGATWTRIAMPQTENYSDIQVLSNTEAYLVGGDSIGTSFYRHTTNGGNTWTRVNVPTIASDSPIGTVGVVHARASGAVWFGGYAGTIRSISPTATPLRLALRTTIPASVAPGVELNVEFDVLPGSEQVVDSAVSVQYRARPSDPYSTIPAVRQASGVFHAVLPRVACGQSPRFFLRAVGSAGAAVTLPASAPAATLAFAVGTTTDQLLLSTDFASGLPAGWSVTGLWHVGSVCAPAGGCGAAPFAYYGRDTGCNYNTGVANTGTLTSSPVVLPAVSAGQSITLRFCSAFATENGGGFTGNDQGWVSVLWGTNELELNYEQDTSGWVTRTLDMTAYQGQTIRLRWTFDSIDEQFNSFRGWNVDNIRINAPVFGCTEPCLADFNADGTVGVPDIFAFLSAWFAGDASADVDGMPGIGVPDIFAFLSLWFVGC